MLSFNSSTCMPRSLAAALRARALLGGTCQRPSCRRQSTKEATRPGKDSTAPGFERVNFLIARGDGDLARKHAIRVGWCALFLVLEDAAANLRRFLVGHVLDDFGVEDRHLTLQAVPNGGDHP